MLNLEVYAYLFLGLTAFFINIPLGYIREGCPKFSLAWLFWIHASIPAIIVLRLNLGTSKWFIPVCIALAIAGQIKGSRWRKARQTQSEKDRLAQIPDLRLSVQVKNIPDKEVAVVLLNMGGPPSIEEVRPFLRRLFLDNLILRVPLSFIFQPVFAFLIVTLRAKVTEHRYSLIGGGSPILKSTRAQAGALSRELKRRGRNILTTVCFNYSYPLPQDALKEIKDLGKKYILPLSLYPHYSAATTGSNLFYLERECQKNYPEAVVLSCPEYHLHEGYIEGLVERIREQILPTEHLDDFYLLFSAHGLPLYFLVEGDLYPYFISQTIACVLGRLKREDRWAISYQSAVGPLQWLKPSTDDMLAALARKGQKRLLIVPIAFVTDHIETLCEIDIEYRKVAEDLGISDFRMSRALECHPRFVSALADTVEKVLPFKTSPHPAAAQKNDGQPQGVSV